MAARLSYSTHFYPTIGFKLLAFAAMEPTVLNGKFNGLSTMVKVGLGRNWGYTILRWGIVKVFHRFMFPGSDC